MNVFTIRDITYTDEVMARVAATVLRGLTGGPVAIEVKRPKRSPSQNSKLWPLLSEIAEHVEWYGKKLTKENWKDVFTAALKKQLAVPGIDGGLVMLGSSTSRMSKAEFSDLLELIQAFGCEHDVKFSSRVDYG